MEHEIVVRVLASLIGDPIKALFCWAWNTIWSLVSPPKAKHVSTALVEVTPVESTSPFSLGEWILWGAYRISIVVLAIGAAWLMISVSTGISLLLLFYGCYFLYWVCTKIYQLCIPKTEFIRKDAVEYC